ncbi:MAG: succinate dehydrogenase cytochrome b subunit [Planctomycetota bacterium]|nr:succinate dehydrogenase cytochrome b subunit [Planctomycetota bacterium]
MEAPARVTLTSTRIFRPLASTIALKVVMAVTGLVLFGFVIGHMIGNLQVYLPRGADGVWALDAYGKFLHEIGHGGAIWIARAGLLAALAMHIAAAWTLTRRSLDARPVGYRQWKAKQSTYASRTMRISGPLIFLFVVYHLLHLTIGSVHPDYIQLGVHHNVTTGLAQPLAGGVYVIAMLGLGIHLYHGIWSLMQTLGLAHPRHERLRRAIAAVSSALVVLGNVSIPIAALCGWLPV